MSDGTVREPATAEGNTYSCTLQVRWADFDRLGHVNNTRYIEYAQEARVLFMRDALTRTGQPTPVLVVRRLEVDFSRPLLPDSDSVQVDVTIGRIGTTSVVMHHVMYDAFGTEVCRVDAILVALDQSTDRPQAIEEHHRATLTRYVRRSLEGT